MSKDNSKLIYLVEDDPVFGEIVKFNIEAIPNYKVKWFMSGEELLTDLDNKPHVIVLDYNLKSFDPSRMNGDEVAKELRLRGLDIPMIMMSSTEDMNLVLKLTKIGVIDFIEKNGDYVDRLNSSLKDAIAMVDIRNDLGIVHHSLKRDRKRLFIGFACAAVISAMAICLKILIA